MSRSAAVLVLALLTSCHCGNTPGTAGKPLSAAAKGSPAGRCTAGDRAACGAAMAGVLARTVALADLPAARKACELDEASGCTVLGLAAAQGIGGPKDAKRALELARRACELGGALGCRLAGEALQEGAGISQDTSAAALLYDKACEGGEAIACARLGQLALEGETASEDPGRIETLLRKGCVAHVAEACKNLSDAYHDGAFGPEDPERDLEIDTLACDGGAALPCLYVFKRYSQTPTDNPMRQWDKQEMPLVALACERGEPQGCELGARMHRDFLEKCDMDRHPGTCFLLALTDIYGVGTPRDEARARALLEELCVRGSQEACDRLGELDGGSGVP